MKKCILFFVGSFLFAIGFSVNAAIPVTVMDLKTIEPVDTFYTGELTAVEKGVLSFEEPGCLEYIAPVGTYVYSEIKDPKTGKVLREGTVVAKQMTERREFELKAAIMQKSTIESGYISSKRDYERNKKLVDKKIVSEKDYSNSLTDMLSAKAMLIKAVHEVGVREYFLNRNTLLAPFTGIVTKTLLQIGTRACDGRDAIEITKMSPLLVKIPLPLEVVDATKEGVEANVYPPGISESVETRCTSGVTSNMLYAYVKNKVISTTKLTAKQEKMKKVYKIHPVIPISDSAEVVGDILNSTKTDVPIAVPVNAVRTDKNGTYVLKINKKQGKDLSEFSVDRVYIKFGDVSRKYYNLGLFKGEKIQVLEDAGDLSVDDLVVLLGNKDIQDGETVVKENLRWKFMPGELVKVSIPALCEPGIYVPSGVIIHHADGDNYVYLVEDGKAKLTFVQIVGKSSEYLRIIGDGIKDGAQVVVINSDKNYDEIYGGVDIDIKNTLPPPEKITRPHREKLKDL